jgi:ATP-dependent Clp protease protease subunit
MAKLLALNGVQAGSPLKVYSKSATEAEIVIYSQIGQDWFGEGVTAKSFSEELKKLPESVNTINVRINSPGGDVFDGIAIFNRLKQHKAKKIVHIDGLAASIASIIALAGDEVRIGEGALFMIHLPWTFTMGNRMELENTQNRLIDIEEQMLGIYAKKTKMDRSEIRAMLEKETWLDADEALEHGFVDAKAEDTVAIAASAIGSKWIAKQPGKYFSQDEAKRMANAAKINSVKEKVRSRLDRK